MTVVWLFDWLFVSSFLRRCAKSSSRSLCDYVFNTDGSMYTQKSP